MRETKKVFILVLALILFVLYIPTGCNKMAIAPKGELGKRTIVDQVGRTVEIPEKIERVAALHPFGGKLVYALGQGDKMAHKFLFWKEGDVMESLDTAYAALPELKTDPHQTVTAEAIMTVKPDIVFSYAAFDQFEIEECASKGLTVVGIKGETLEETYEAIQLIGKVLGCKKDADDFEAYIKEKVILVEKRSKGVKDEEKPKILFTGPKGMYTVASGDMFQGKMIEMAGGINVSKELKGKWCGVSPEQIVAWNPDYIFLASYFGTNTVEDFLRDPALSTTNAVKNRNVFIFPSNIIWWDFPLPQSVLGAIWIGKTIFPEKYGDIDMVKIADEYYERALGYSFTEMGGRL